MNDRGSELPLALSIVFSVLLHLVIILPLWMLAMSTPGPAHALQSDLRSEDIEAPTEPPDPKLGLESPNPSSLTWVGYEEYREHIAALEQFDQAAFTEHPEQVLADLPAAEQLHANPPELEVIEPSEPAGAAVTEAVEVPEQVLVVPVDPVPGMLPWLIQNPEQTSSDEISEPELVQSSDGDIVEAADDVEESPSEDESDQSPTTSEQTDGRPVPESDRESDPTSTIDANPEHWRLGQPLAAEGVELKPRQPHFTLLQRLTTSPGNPIVLIQFSRDGVPESATVERSSGSPSVDSSIETSLYRWRAEGDAIDTLGFEQTFNVRIRIVLNPRAD